MVQSEYSLCLAWLAIPFQLLGSRVHRPPVRAQYGRGASSLP
jgi:hypothetical protein